MPKGTKKTDTNFNAPVDGMLTTTISDSTFTTKVVVSDVYPQDSVIVSGSCKEILMKYSHLNNKLETSLHLFNEGQRKAIAETISRITYIRQNHDEEISWCVERLESLSNITDEYLMSKIHKKIDEKIEKLSKDLFVPKSIEDIHNDLSVPQA